MADDIGNPGQLLGVASDAQAKVQQQKNYQNAQAQDVANTALAPSQEAGKVAAVQQADKITVNHEMGQGIAKLTGDDGWQRIGDSNMKFDPRIFTALVSAQSKKSYHDELIDAGLLKQSDMEDFKKKSQEEKEEAEAQRQKDKETEQTQREHDREDTQRAIAEMRSSSKGGEAAPIKAGMLRKFMGPGAVPKEVGDDEDVPPLLAKTVMTQKDDVAAFTKILNSLKNPLTGLPPNAIEQATQIFQQMKQQSGDATPPASIPPVGPASGPSISPSSSKSDTVRVKNKDGKTGTIPRSQLKDALSNGYTQVQ